MERLVSCRNKYSDIRKYTLMFLGAGVFSFVQYSDKRFISYVLKNPCYEKLEFQNEFCITMVNVLCLRFLVCDQWCGFET